MKARILETGRCILYTQEFLDFKGNEISDWNLTDILPSSDLLIPIWNGLEWVEGITEQELQIRKQQKIDELNRFQFDELSVTDWYIIRKLDTGTEIPLDVFSQRNEIRLKYNNLKNGI
jgi:hypothetical protein